MAPAAAPRGAVVIVHGLKDHSSRYDGFARRVVAEGFAVHAFDLRGHGRSEGVRVAIDDFSEYLDDLAVELVRVRAREPGVPVFLMGHSMGGAIVTLFALERRPAVSGLVLSAAALAVDASAITVGGTKAVAAISPDAGVFQLDLDDFSRDPAVVAENRADPLVYQDAAPARTAALLIGAIDTIGEREGELDVPVLALHGDADHVTPPEGSRELVRRARTRDKTLKTYPGLVHDLLHEPERETVVRDIVAWLDARAR